MHFMSQAVMCVYPAASYHSSSSKMPPPPFPPPSSPLGLIAKRSNENREGIDLRVRGQDLGETLRPDAIALQVGITQHHHEVLVSFLSRQLLDAGVRSFQGVVAAHAELSVGVHGLQSNRKFTNGGRHPVKPAAKELLNSSSVTHTCVNTLILFPVCEYLHLLDLNVCL